MVPNLAAIQCLTAVLLLLLVPGHSTDLKFLVEGLGYHQRFGINPNHGAILSINAKINQQTSRAMLQFAIQQFCRFREDECLPDTLNNLPDEDTLNMFIQLSDCLQIATESACDGQPSCIWLQDMCIPDYTMLIQDCLDPTYLTLHRGLECQEFVVQSKCTAIPGCLWNGATCEIDRDTVITALGQNQLLREKLEQQLECSEVVSCTGVCELAYTGDCVFPGFLDFSPFVTARTPFCNYIKQVAVCESTLNPDACRGACGLTDNGFCSFLTTTEQFVDITYVDNPALQAQMRIAVQQCPAISLPSACNAFSP